MTRQQPLFASLFVLWSVKGYREGGKCVTGRPYPSVRVDHMMVPVMSDLLMLRRKWRWGEVNQQRRDIFV